MDHAAGSVDLAAVLFGLEPLDREFLAADGLEGFTPPGIGQTVDPQKRRVPVEPRFGQANIAIERLDGPVLQFGPGRGGRRMTRVAIAQASSASVDESSRWP